MSKVERQPEPGTGLKKLSPFSRSQFPYPSLEILPGRPWQLQAGDDVERAEYVY